jgi:RNA polymerase sigma factor (sigma-70 family)
MNGGAGLMEAEREQGIAGDSLPAFADVVAEHHSDMVRLAYGMMGQLDLADDVVQSAWAAAWQHRGQLRDPAKLRGWLLTITANQARKALRSQAVSRWLPLVGEPRAASVRAEVEGTLDLVAALQRLAPRDRLIVLMRYGLGESSAEIGLQVGLSDSGVRVRLSRVLVQLRGYLDDD